MLGEGEPHGLVERLARQRLGPEQMGGQQVDLPGGDDERPDAFAADAPIGVDPDGAALRADDVACL